MSCVFCGCVSVPEKNICPECIWQNAKNKELLDPFTNDEIGTEDLDIEYLQFNSIIHSCINNANILR